MNVVYISKTTQKTLNDVWSPEKGKVKVADVVKVRISTHHPIRTQLEYTPGGRT